MKYYIDTSIEDDAKWKYMIASILQKAETVEFNILYKRHEKSLEKEFGEDFKLASYLSNVKKIYSSGKCVQFPLTENIKNILMSKDYSSWNNNYIEDPSFRKNGEEIFATITHEHYVIMLLSETERLSLNSQGFEFETEWKL